MIHATTNTNATFIVTTEEKRIDTGVPSSQIRYLFKDSTVTLAEDYAPVNENDILTPAANSKGVVKGSIEKGKLNVAEATGSEEVQYTEHPAPSGTNYIYIS